MPSPGPELYDTRIYICLFPYLSISMCLHRSLIPVSQYHEINSTFLPFQTESPLAQRVRNLASIPSNIFTHWTSPPFCTQFPSPLPPPPPHVHRCTPPCAGLCRSSWSPSASWALTPRAVGVLLVLLGLGQVTPGRHSIWAPFLPWLSFETPCFPLKCRDAPPCAWGSVPPGLAICNFDKWKNNIF